MAAGCSGSGLSLSYNNYDNWNTNTNCSPHLSDVFRNAGPAPWQKITQLKKSVGILFGRRLSFKSKGKMKRVNNLFQHICSIENLQAADVIARKGKAKQYGIKLHDRNREENIRLLHEALLTKTYCTSAYSTFIIHEPKEREIFRLPYYPDRIVHHSIMIHLEKIFVNTFTRDTYSCIKGRGIHAAADGVKKSLALLPDKGYCLKLDIKKFYPNVDHGILKQLLRKIIKDADLLWLLDNIIDSAPGLPIGNYLSQYLANFYLSYFDHWIKEEKKVHHYFRYADDLVLLSGSKEELHRLYGEISGYLQGKLKLTVKSNHQVFLIADHPKAPGRGLDFLGYVFYRTHTRLRKTIKQNFARKVSRGITPESAASYRGWTKWANCNHLLKTLFKKAA